MNVVFFPDVFSAGRRTCLVAWTSFMPLDRFAARLKKRLEKKLHDLKKIVTFMGVVYCSSTSEKKISLQRLLDCTTTNGTVCFMSGLPNDYVPTRRDSVRHVPIRRVHPDAVSVRRVPTRRVPIGRVSA